MKRLNIYIILLMAITFALSSCIDDKGNYDYKNIDELLPTAITNLPEEYVAQGHITLSPTIVGLAEGIEFEYRWYVKSKKTDKITEIANTKDLDQDLRIENGEYKLNLLVTNAASGIYLRKVIDLLVSPLNINTGWYILKDIDNMTDFDYIRTDVDVNTNEEVITYQRDVLKTQAIPQDSRLKGKALKILFQNFSYSHEVVDENGKVEVVHRLSALHVASDESLKTFNPLEMKLYKDTENQFYISPTKINFQNLVFGTSLYLLNDDKMHAIGGQTLGVGKYGYSTPAQEKINRFIGGNATHALYFDETTSSFKMVAPTKISYPSSFADPVSTDDRPSLNNMNVDMITMMVRLSSVASLQTQSVLQNRVTKDYYIVGLTTNGSVGYPSKVALVIDTIFSTIKVEMPLADVFASPTTGNFIYFAKDNKVSVHYNNALSVPKEATLLTLPAGEKVSHLGYLMVYPSREQLLTVLTNSTAGWKHYHHKVKTVGIADIDPHPIRVLSGEGIAREMLKR